MAGFQMIFFLLQKAVASFQIKRKRKQEYRFFSLCLDKIQAAKLILQPQQYYIYKNVLPCCTVAPYTKNVTRKLQSGHVGVCHTEKL